MGLNYWVHEVCFMECEGGWAPPVKRAAIKNSLRSIKGEIILFLKTNGDGFLCSYLLVKAIWRCLMCGKTFDWCSWGYFSFAEFIVLDEA